MREGLLLQMTQHVQESTFNRLISATNMDRVLAMKVATDAANHYARILRLLLSEAGVKVTA